MGRFQPRLWQHKHRDTVAGQEGTGEERNREGGAEREENDAHGHSSRAGPQGGSTRLHGADRSSSSWLPPLYVTISRTSLLVNVGVILVKTAEPCLQVAPGILQQLLQQTVGQVGVRLSIAQPACS
jgi:hypothetical protein